MMERRLESLHDVMAPILGLRTANLFPMDKVVEPFSCIMLGCRYTSLYKQIVLRVLGSRHVNVTQHAVWHAHDHSTVGETVRQLVVHGSVALNVHIFGNTNESPKYVQVHRC